MGSAEVPTVGSRESGTSAAAPDVIVVGSGIGGMVAALRAHHLGLSVIMIEKSHAYGGSSATSGGGMWVPLNRAVAERDSVEQAMTYLRAITAGKASDKVLQTYVDNAALAAEFLGEMGVRTASMPAFADYFSEEPGALFGRGLTPLDFDGELLGDELFRMRDCYPLMAFGRYALNARQAFLIGSRQKGWLSEAIMLIARYWLDLSWRLKTRVDRRLTFGRALIGGLRRAMLDRQIPLLLEHRLVALLEEGGVVRGVTLDRGGRPIDLSAGFVILAAGGFEHNQTMREHHHPVRTFAKHSLTPPGANEGDAIVAGKAVGGTLEHMEQAWWEPTVQFPLPAVSNLLLNGDLFFSRGRPGTLCVNRLGKRFCNEALSYDRFGQAMIADHQATGANLPCWMILDASFRNKWPAGALRPSWIMSDRRVPPGAWDTLVYRADTVEDLAVKIGLDPPTLAKTVATFNEYCTIGTDAEFARGETPFERALGDPCCRPNPNLGPLAKAPYYALKVELGDIGTKGGLKINHHGQVLRDDGEPIPGLYATGNTTASIFADTYPGPGATLGAAMTFGFVAANHAAASAHSHRDLFGAVV